jgi:hypothetical protein
MGQSTTNAANLLVGAGRAFFARTDATTGIETTGLRFLGDCSELRITPAEDEVREHYSSAEAARPLMKRVPIRRKVTFNLKLHEFSIENLALALMGDQSEYTQANTPIVDEILSTAPIVGAHYGPTAKRAIGTITVKRGATTIPSGEYDLVDAEAGIIFLHNVAATFTGATGNLTISYTPTAIVTGSGRAQVAGGKSTTVEGRLFYLPDPTTGPKTEISVWHISMSPEGDIGLIADDFGEVTVKGEVLTDATNHPAAPYYLVTQRP